MPITMQPVSSSQIQSMGHDPETSSMRVQFHNGAEYEYQGVPAEVFESVSGSGSVGAAFNAEIKAGGYSFTRL